MNLDKLFPAFFFICMGTGASIGYFGDGPTLTSTVNGAAIGLAVGLSPLVVLGIAVRLITLWCPERPICMCGSGNSSDYQYLNHHSVGTDFTFFYRCPKCRREYRQHDKRFDLRLSKNEFQPYMTISKWGRWSAD